MQATAALVLLARERAPAGTRSAHVDVPDTGGHDASAVRFREMLASVRQKTPEEPDPPPSIGAGPEGDPRALPVMPGEARSPQEAPPAIHPGEAPPDPGRNRVQSRSGEEGGEDGETRARRRERAAQMLVRGDVHPVIDHVRNRLEIIREVRRDLAGLIRNLRRETVPGEGSVPQAASGQHDPGMERILDRLRRLLPPERLEAITTGFTALGREMAAGQAARVTPDRTTVPAQRLQALLKVLPGSKELDSLMDKALSRIDLEMAAPPGGPAALHGRQRSRGRAPVRGPQGRDVAETDLPRVTVRDQRINDPHSLREAVRVVRRDPQTAEKTAPGRPATEAATPPGEMRAMPPVAGPKAGNQTALFMQHEHRPERLQETARSRAADRLREPRQVVRQIVERASLTVKSGMTEMHVQLNPRDMGRIGMHFSLAADGELSARLVASNETVRQYLQDNLAAFSRDLADAGVHVTHLEVAADGRQQQFGRESSQADREGHGGQDLPGALTTAELPAQVRPGPVTAGNDREGAFDVRA